MSDTHAEADPRVSGTTKLQSGPKGAQHFGTRTAEVQGRFFLPQLQAGWSILDCGCGPGSITFGLAQAVAPGEVQGIDVDPDRIALARTEALERGTRNVRFDVASVYQLPYAEQTFDAVFCNCVCEHLTRPGDALREIKRVLKPGGVVGVRSPSNDGILLAPTDPLLSRFWTMWQTMFDHRGSNARIGKSLKKLLREAGFARVEAGAEYEVYSTQEATRYWGGGLPSILRDDAFTVEVLDAGLSDRDELAAMGAAWERWSNDPDAFFADAFCTALAWK